MKDPKYKYGDEVYIYANRYREHIRPTPEKGKYASETIRIEERKMEKLDGVVYIVDRGGTWDNNNEEPSYDVYVHSCNCLYKHITESEVYPYA